MLLCLLHAAMAAAKPAVVSKFDASDLAIIAGLCGGTFSWCSKEMGDSGRCDAEAKSPSPGARPMCEMPKLSKLCGDHEGSVIVHRVYRGAFSSAKANEALVDFTTSCSAHPGNFGGHALLPPSGGTWKLLMTDIKRTLQDCVVYAGTPPAGQFLACGYVSNYLGEGGSVTWELGLYRVKNDNLEAELLLRLCHEQPGDCTPGAEVSWFDPWVPVLNTRDVNGDGRPDLSVHVTVGHLVVPSDACDGVNSSWDRGTWLKGGQRDTVTVAFENDGTGLQVTPAAARAMTRIRDIVGSDSWKRCESPMASR